MLAIKPSDLLELKAVLAQNAPDLTVFAYGSRVVEDKQVVRVKPFSDLDLAFTGPALPVFRMFLLRSALEESNLPFRVDICNWQDLPATWKPQLKTVQIQ